MLVGPSKSLVGIFSLTEDVEPCLDFFLRSQAVGICSILFAAVNFFLGSRNLSRDFQN